MSRMYRKPDDRLHGFPANGRCISKHTRNYSLNREGAESLVLNFFESHPFQSDTTFYLLFEVCGFDPKNYTDPNGVHLELKNWPQREAASGYNLLNRTVLPNLARRGLLARRVIHRTNYWSLNRPGQLAAVMAFDRGNRHTVAQRRHISVKGLSEPVSDDEALEIAGKLIEAVRQSNIAST